MAAAGAEARRACSYALAGRAAVVGHGRRCAVSWPPRTLTVLRLSALRGLFSARRRGPGDVRQRAGAGRRRAGSPSSSATAPESPNHRSVVECARRCPTARRSTWPARCPARSRCEKIVQINGRNFDLRAEGDLPAAQLRRPARRAGPDRHAARRGRRSTSRPRRSARTPTAPTRRCCCASTATSTRRAGADRRSVGATTTRLISSSDPRRRRIRGGSGHSGGQAGRAALHPSGRPRWDGRRRQGRRSR